MLLKHNMVPCGYIPIHVKSYHRHTYDVERGGICSSMKMGPVSAAISLYVLDRFLARALAGQLLRKGVYRKIRRLVSMITDWEIVCDMVCEQLDDWM
jgi:hypothetical protein